MLDLDGARTLVALLRQRFAEQQGYLDALDRAVGDGDHGTTMARAWRQAEQDTAETEFDDLGMFFDAVATSVSESAGGAVGPLLAALLAEAGSTLRGKTTAGLADILQCLERGAQAISEIGGAQPGEKTLIDALLPAVEAMRQRVGRRPDVALAGAAAAARRGAEDTRAMRATRGRARFLGERSEGHQDPGATSIAIMFSVFLDLAWHVRPKPAEATAKPAVQPVPGKLVNDPARMITEELEGLALAHPRYIRQTATPGVLARATPKAAGKVGLAIGHGGGHTPSMAGFIGEGLLDADAYGPLFTCASGVRIAAAIAEADRGAGVVLLVSNHAGDVLNARLAVRRAEQLGIITRSVLLTDDVATAPRERYLERRGLGGLLFALKVGGAAAEAGCGLDEVAELMARVNERTATLAVAVKAPTHPATGKPLFDLAPGHIEIGTGVHGESGVYSGPHLPADQIVDLLLDRLVPDLGGLIVNDRVWAFVNGAGATSMMELHILYRRVAQGLAARGLSLADGVVNTYFTTQDMAGFSLSLCALDDDLARWWDAPARGAYFHHP